MISEINQEPRPSLDLFDNTSWPSMTTSLNENIVIFSDGFKLVSVQLSYGYQTEMSLIDLLLAKASLYTLGQGNLLRGIVNSLTQLVGCSLICCPGLLNELSVTSFIYFNLKQKPSFTNIVGHI